jgi:malate dehydrogenase (oxaloacetate-decarboxylating)
MSADKEYVAKMLKLHEENKRKIEAVPRVKITDPKVLSEFYTPGVAEPCIAISKKKEDVYKYTNKGNIVAVVSDGTAVLGLGDIGPEAGLPVMEGKCILFKTFADIDAIPIMIDSKDPEEIIKAVKLVSPGLGAINLEDIAAPKCFEIERRLKKELKIPVMHDDQHGTAIVIIAGLINALKLAGKSFKDVKIIFSGAGAAGTAITKMLLAEGCKNIIIADRAGAIYKGRTDNMNAEKEELAKITNPDNVKGTLDEIIKGADVFIGVSGPGLLTKDHVKSMGTKPIIFAVANPIPEIMPADAKEAGAFIVATGRSDFPNQVNNCLAFPGVFRGALDVHATDINDEMKMAAANCLADWVKSPTVDCIIPSAFEQGLALKVGEAVAQAAIKSGVVKTPKA